MTKKQVPIIILAILALLLLGQYRSTLASTNSPDFFALADYNQPKFKADTSSVEGGVVQKRSNEVKAIVNKWEEKKLKGPGWIHFVYKSRSDFDNGVILPDGSMMPKVYITDGWYWLNAQNLVEQDVILIKDEAGHVLQQAVFSNGTETNLTFGEKREGAEPYRLAMDFGFSQSLSEMGAKGGVVSTQEANDRGKLRKEFACKGNFEKPVKLGNSQSAVESITIGASFDLEATAMNRFKTTWKLVDGTEVLFDDTEIMLLEKTEVSKDIAALLEMVR